MGHDGAIGPEAAEHVGLVDEFVAAEAVAVAEGFFEGLDAADALAEAVEGHFDGLFLEMGCEPVGDADGVGDARGMEFDAGTGELLAGLDEEAAVGPEAGVVLGNDQVAGFAGEAAEPFDLFPTRCDVFAAVGIGGGDDHCVVAFCADALDPRRKNNVILCHNLQR